MSFRRSLFWSHLVTAVAVGLVTLLLAATGLLLTMWASWFMAEMRGNMGETVRNLLIWGALVTVVAIAYSYKTQFGF